MSQPFVIDGRPIGLDHPTYFIADIAANHDGSLERACELIRLAKASGADAAKFQHFTAEKIVSDVGFRSLGRQLSHQSSWSRPVSEVYAAASVPHSWTTRLFEECQRVGITFFSSPYDPEAVDHLDPFVPAYKIGSGDIDWIEQLRYVAGKGKPVILATGASSMSEVVRAVEEIREINPQVALLQCNTNYTASPSNVEHLNLRVLETFRAVWPDLVVGISDHTHGHAAILGSVALGGRIVERHFTDDNSREGPDHRFALNPAMWREMVDETRQLESALGSRVKQVAANESETVIVQRRCLRAARNIPSGHRLMRQDLDVLRPATPGAIRPDRVDAVVGRTTSRALYFGEAISWADLET